MVRDYLCCAEGRESGWEALCLDLDIAVQGGSFEEVYRSLKEAVGLYLDSLTDLNDSERARLMARRSQLSIRLSVIGSALRTALVGGPPGRQHAIFTLPAPT